MATSKEIRALLTLMDEKGTNIQLPISIVEGLHDADPESIPDPEDVELRKFLREVTAQVVKAKLEPTREFSDEFMKCIERRLGDDALDECFTRIDLELIPVVVSRWKRLKMLSLVGLPGEEVNRSLKQATECYLHGLPTASVILCRTVLQFALEERIPDVGGVRVIELPKEHYLEKLIGFAGSSKVLSWDLVSEAHQVRIAGNEAVHEKKLLNDAVALKVLEETSQLLKHLYKAPRHRSL